MRVGLLVLGWTAQMILAKESLGEFKTLEKEAGYYESGMEKGNKYTGVYGRQGMKEVDFLTYSQARTALTGGDRGFGREGRC